MPDRDRRFLTLLDHVYDLPDEVEEFDALMAAARDYFFDAEHDWQIAHDIPREQVHDPLLAPHVARIERLAGADLVEDPGQAALARMSEVSFARILVGAGGLIVSGNAAAEALLGSSFPARLTASRLTDASARVLGDAVRTKASSRPRILPVYLGEDTAPSMAILDEVRLEDGTKLVGVSFSHVVWDRARIATVGEALDLSASETETLAGYLNGLTQREIAERRGRSVETVKAQSKAILRKTGTARMSDVILLANSVAYLVPQVEKQPVAAIAARDDRVETLRRPDGRQVSWRRFGRAGGRKVVFLHAFSKGPFFTDAMQRDCAARDLDIIAPSRPAFGATDPAPTRPAYLETVVDDLRAILSASGDGPVILAANQLGTRSAHPIARAGDIDVKGMVSIGGGIPLDDRNHTRDMDWRSRIHFIGTRHAPMMMELLVKASIRKVRRHGTLAYQKAYYEKNPDQLAEISDPAIFPLISKAMDHAIVHGSEAFMCDFGVVCEDWSAEWPLTHIPVHWLHGTADPTVNIRHVRALLGPLDNFVLTELEGGGMAMLYTHAEAVVAAMGDMADRVLSPAR